MQATVNEFKTDGSGFATLTYTLKNVGSSSFSISDSFDINDTNRYLRVQPNNVQIQDEQEKVTHYTLSDSSLNCLCFWSDSSSDYGYLEPGEDATFANMFEIGDEATTVTVQLPGFQPVKGVAVQRP